jgi:WD40 repeat protein
MKPSFLALGVLLVVLPACDDDGTKPVTDSTAPARVEDLAVQDSAGGVVTLVWTAPGDDGSEGQAARYDIRCSTTLASEAEWNAATVVDSSRVPKAAGEPESLEVADLDQGTWHFALETADEVPNWSEMSNVASATLVDTTAPGPVTDLAAVLVTAITVKLGWTAPGDGGSNGTVSAYDLRYALTPITEGNWAEATQVEGVSGPGAAGSREFHTVTGLSQGTAYSFALKAIDDSGNESDLSNVLNQPTADLVQLTFSPSCWPPCAVMDPDWSTAGQIAFAASWEEGFPHTEIYTIPEDGGERILLTEAPDYARYPSWSPDGTQLAYSAPTATDVQTIWIMDAVSQGNAVPLVAVEPGTLDNPSWSPDGDRIAYTLTTWVTSGPPMIIACDIYTIGVTGGSPELVVHDTDWIRGLDWSPDGSQIVFSSTRGGDCDIWVVSSTGGTPTQLTHDPGSDISPSWSPDGRYIAFTSDRGAEAGAWVMDPTGAEPTQLFGARGDICWSPDANGVAFTYNSDLWLMRWWSSAGLAAGPHPVFRRAPHLSPTSAP